MPVADLPLPAPIAKSSLAGSAYNVLLEAILAGQIPAGTELSEVELAARLGVSRTPVHEALRRLGAEGLVRTGSDRLVRVTSFTKDEIRDLYEVRSVLESAAARLAAERMPAPAVAELTEAADALKHGMADPDWPARALAFDVRFHDALAAGSGNARLAGEIGRYRLLVRAFCRITGNPGNLRDAMDEHRAILAALQARNADAAARAMSGHIDKRLASVVATV